MKCDVNFCHNMPKRYKFAAKDN